MVDSSSRNYFYYYLHLFWKQPASSFFKNNNFCFQENLGHLYQKSYWKRSWPIHQIPFKAYSMPIFAAAKASLVSFKEATKLYFMRYPRMVINFVNRVYISLYISYLFLWKITASSSSVFFVFCRLCVLNFISFL